MKGVINSDAMRKVICSSVIIIRYCIGVLIGYAFSNYVFKNMSPSCERTAKNSVQVLNNVTLKEENLLFVGVMTADKFLETRAKAIYETWGQSVSGNIMFFSSENSSSKSNIPLVRLANVDDSYPPQNKSLEMLKYMYKHYPHYKFYLRADDDMYVKTEMLHKFLNSVNSSKPLLIGQPGYGIKKERPVLHLLKNKPFCMGGPGIIISNKALQLFSKHINDCVHLHKTPHEDVEFWRCMNHYVGISCTKSKEMRRYFIHRKGLEKDVAYVAIHMKDVANALTLHPLKNHHQLYKLHLALQIQQIQAKEYDIHSVLEEISRIKGLLKDVGNRTENGTTFETSESSNTKISDSVEWNIYQAGSYYTPNKIYDDSSYGNSSLNIAQNNVDSFLSNLSLNRQKFGSEFYVRNLPGVGTDFIMEKLTHTGTKSSKTKRNFFSRVLQSERKKQLRVKIPYGTLMVREIENHSSFEDISTL